MLFKKGKEVLQSEGLLPFIKRAFLFLIKFLFSYKIYYIYERRLNKTNKFEFVPKIQNITLRVIYTPMEVDDLSTEGFGFSAYPSIENLKGGFGKGAILFCVFIERELAHTSWVARTNTAAICDPVFQRMNYQDATYIFSCFTNTEYRGLGLYPHVLSQICKFLEGKGRSKVLINTAKSNLPSTRGITKAGFKRCSEVRYLKLLFWKFWKEKQGSVKSFMKEYENKYERSTK